MPYTPEQLKSRYDKLPADVQQAMDSVDTTNAVVDVGEKYDLMYDQISDLVDEVGLVMLGLTPSGAFVGNVSRRLKVNMSKAMLVAQDINKEVFDKMRQSLQQIEAGHEEGYSEESGTAAPEKPAGESEETPMTDAEKATQRSVIDSVEKAGGFVIDRPATPDAREVAREKPEPRNAVINILERDTFVAPASPGSSAVPVPPDHLLGDTPEPTQKTADARPPFEQEAGHDSIVDTLLSKGVAMPMDPSAPKAPIKAPSPKPEVKARPYDGTDPYREPTA